MIRNVNNNLFYCYSHKLAYFIKSQGISYVSKGTNKKNNLTYFTFEKSKKLDEVICTWNNLKLKEDKE